MNAHHFPLLHQKKIIYLDSSATSQKPQVVLDAMDQFYQMYNANVHRGIYRLAEQATLMYEQAREIAAQFINALPEEIIFTKGTTESLNILALSLGKNIKRGDEIVLTEMEHHSNLIPWQQIAKEKQCMLKFIPLTEEYHLDLNKARELITPRTKIVAITHLSNVLGTITPVRELADMAHGVHAVLVLDAAQSAPYLSLDVQQLDCDFLAFSGHKMCGPTGIGVLYGKKSLLQKLEPVTFGGGMITEVTFTEAKWNDIPYRFEAGTPPLAEAIGLAAAIQYLQSLGMETITYHGKELTQYALHQLNALPGMTIIGPSTMEQRGPVISFTVEGIHPHDVSELLDKEHIAVRGGHHCAMPLMKKLGLPGTVRISLYMYNSTEDIDALIQALRSVQRKFQ